MTNSEKTHKGHVQLPHYNQLLTLTIDPEVLSTHNQTKHLENV